MKKTFKILALVLVLILAIGVLVACNDDPAPTPDGGTPGTPDTPATPDTPGTDDESGNKNQTFTVTFKYGDKVFAVLPVKKGTKIFNPTFKPSSDGGWDFDFSQAINEDTVIDWKKK